jgi:CRISPR-associated protein Cas2
MWLFTLFDLPVVSKKDRKNYTRFRKTLLTQGFSMLQFSVYARYCASEDRGRTLINRIHQQLPPSGQVRLLLVTDHQFGKMEVYNSKSRDETEKPPEQLMLF